MNWDSYFNRMAHLVATKSKDRSTQVGCVIVGPEHEVRTTGYNGFCRGIDDEVDSRHARPEKYMWTEHAERNAIYNAARNGMSLNGCTAYTTIFTCADCARALIQSGIKRVCTPAYSGDTYIQPESYHIALAMMQEAEVQVDFLPE